MYRLPCTCATVTANTVHVRRYKSQSVAIIRTHLRNTSTKQINIIQYTQTWGSQLDWSYTQIHFRAIYVAIAMYIATYITTVTFAILNNKEKINVERLFLSVLAI